ncbi:hypothetical protein WN943_020043 [Citrus x changshan-huyou]
MTVIANDDVDNDDDANNAVIVDDDDKDDEDAKSIGCGYGARGDDIVECVLFVLRSDGVGGNGGGSQRLMEMRLNNDVLLLLVVLLNWTTVAFLFPFYRVETMLFFMTILLL